MLFLAMEWILPGNTDGRETREIFAFKSWESAHPPIADPDPVAGEILLISKNMWGWSGQEMHKTRGGILMDVPWQVYIEVLILWQDRSNPAPRKNVEANEE